MAGVSKARRWTGARAGRENFIVGVITVVVTAVVVITIIAIPLGVIPVDVVAVGLVAVDVVAVGIIAIIFHGGCDLLVNLIRRLLDHQTPCPGLNMNGKRTKTEYLLLLGSWTRVAHQLGRWGLRETVDLELNLLLCVIESELDAVLVTIWQSSNVQEIVARSLGHGKIGRQLPSVRFQTGLADNSELGLIASGINRHRHNAPLLGPCQ